MSNHPITRTLDFQEGIGIEITDEEIENYRQTGDFTIRERLIKAHLRIVIMLAGKRSRRAHNDRNTAFDELVSVGVEALTQGVIWAGPHMEEGKLCSSKLEDNSITPYLASTIKHRMYDFQVEDRMVFMPGRTFRQKAKDGKILSKNNTNPSIIGVVSVLRFATSDNWKQDDYEDMNLGDEMAVAPVAPPDYPEKDLEEALLLAINNEQERRIIDLRLEGYKYQNIASILGLSTSWIQQIVSKVEQRFDKIYRA